MQDSNDPIFSIRNIIDSQLETSDRVEIGRVADIEAELRDDGSLVLTDIVTGPQTLAGRVCASLGSLLRRILHDRFEYHIPLSEVKQFGPTLELRGRARDYSVGQSEQWIANHLLHWIPGSGAHGKNGEKDPVDGSAQQ